MQLFSADAIVFSKKSKNNLTLKTWKNRAQKLLIIVSGPNFFFSTGMAAQTDQNRNPVPLKAP